MKNLRKIFLLFLSCSLSVALLAGSQGKQPKNLVITGARLIDGTGLLVISGDPLKDIRALRKDKIIVQGGKIIKR